MADTSAHRPWVGVGSHANRGRCWGTETGGTSARKSFSRSLSRSLFGVRTFAARASRPWSGRRATARRSVRVGPAPRAHRGCLLPGRLHLLVSATRRISLIDLPAGATKVPRSRSSIKKAHSGAGSGYEDRFTRSGASGARRFHDAWTGPWPAAEEINFHRGATDYSRLTTESCGDHRLPSTPVASSVARTGGVLLADFET